MNKAVILAVVAVIFVFALLGGCGPTTTFNFSVPQPNLQTINTGNPNCQFDCTQTQTATQSIGPGDVQGATVSTTQSGNSGLNLTVLSQ